MVVMFSGLWALAGPYPLTQFHVADEAGATASTPRERECEMVGSEAIIVMEVASNRYGLIVCVDSNWNLCIV